MRRWFSFPDPVNDKAARVVATGVVAMALVYLATRSGWVLVPLVYGFAARVAAGPRYSPLGRLAVHVVAPRLGPPVPVPGPPKRFAQGIGLVFATGIAVGHVAGADLLAVVLAVGLLGAATLEAAFGVCCGCLLFARLMRWGLVPASICETCNDLSRRPAFAAARSGTGSASS